MEQKMATKAKKTPAESLTEAAEKVVEAVTETSRETFETMTRAGSGAMAEAYEKASKFGAEQVGKSSEVYETAVALGKRNLDTLNAVMSAMNEGIEAYNSRVVESWIGATTANMACYEKMMSAKTPQDAAAAQMETFSRLAETSVAEAIELNKLAAATVAKAAAPVKARLDEVFETVAAKAA